MFNENFNTKSCGPVVLVAPLDWGLGHATRCIPIISELVTLGCTVLIAAEGPAKELLQKEFQELHFIELRGYRVRYSRSKSGMPLKMLLQFPRILYRIYAENRWLKKMIASRKIDAVISDNRMGLFASRIPCIYITHQLCIKTGSGFSDTIAQKIHYHYINKFNACWVPDAREPLNLAGELSHPRSLPNIAVKYLGPLSRFKKEATSEKYELCIILSGPEPQRTIFEQLILSELEHVEGNVCLVRGLPGETEVPALNKNGAEIKNHLPAEELNLVILQSKMIICRCGYSSVMDLVKLGKKAILVPTPGQTEQEYLSRYLLGQKIFYSVEQENFSLTEALKSAADFEYNCSGEIGEHFKAVVKEFTGSLSVNNAGT